MLSGPIFNWQTILNGLGQNGLHFVAILSLAISKLDKIVQNVCENDFFCPDFYKWRPSEKISDFKCFQNLDRYCGHFCITGSTQGPICVTSFMNDPKGLLEFKHTHNFYCSIQRLRPQIMYQGRLGVSLIHRKNI